MPDKPLQRSESLSRSSPLGRSSPLSRSRWSSTGFLLASIGAAVGIGNIWRFPYMVGINGGGAFLIPYLIGVLVFSLPLMMLELDTGRQFRGSVVTCFRRLNPRLKLAGVLPVLVSLGVGGYYFVITGWSLAHFLFSFTGYVPFQDFVSGPLPLVFFLVTLGISAAVVSRGIKGGIERMSMILMPLFAVLLVMLAMYSVTLPGAGEGLAFYLTPDFSYLLNPTIWVLGIVQAFFSLAVGYGILITYSSYLDHKTDVRKYALGIAGADTLIALVGGLLVFPIVFTFGLDPAAGSGLTFMSLPLVFQTIPLGFLVGAAFFLLLFVAGLTSAVGFFEVGTTSLVDELSWSRRKATLGAAMIMLLIGIPSSLTFWGAGLSVLGKPLIESLDIFFGGMLLVSASVMALAFTWKRKPGIFSGSGILKKVVMFHIKYVIPVSLVIALIFTLVS